MELFLNIVWLVLALAAMSTWLLARHSAEETRKQQLIAGLVILACALVLLFPVISATDDLHGAQMLQEDSSVKRMIASATGPTVFAEQSVPALASSLLGSPVFSVWGWMNPEPPANPSAFAATTDSSRAPPAI